MALLNWELNYENIDLDKLQAAFNKYKSTVDIEPIYLNDILSNTTLEIFNNIKSWRSNVIEGNTTKLKNLKKIVENNMQDKSGKDVSLDLQKLDEEYEIINLCKAYNSKNKFKVSDIQKINFILGENIQHNNFNEVRGKLKSEENIITYNDPDSMTLYYVNFSKVKDTKDELNKLILFLQRNVNECSSFSEMFVLSLIFNLEFNRIHPFPDGNGRTGRLFMEKIMEDKGFAPLIFSRNESKLIYKKTLFKSDLLEDKYNYEKMIDKMKSIYIDEISELKIQLSNYE